MRLIAPDLYKLLPVVDEADHTRSIQAACKLAACTDKTLSLTEPLPVSSHKILPLDARMYLAGPF